MLSSSNFNNFTSGHNLTKKRGINAMKRMAIVFSSLRTGHRDFTITVVKFN
jgi:hypothetical protein